MAKVLHTASVYHAVAGNSVHICLSEKCFETKCLKIASVVI